MYDVDAEHIRKMLDANLIECLSAATSKAAKQHLERILHFPLEATTSIVDWTRTPSKMLDWMAASDDETAVWAATTIAGKCKFGLLLFYSWEPCLIGPFDFMIRNFDTLVWGAAGPRILFGVERDALGNVEFTRGIIEYNGLGELFATIEPESASES